MLSTECALTNGDSWSLRESFGTKHETVAGIFARITDCGELLGQIGKTTTTEDGKIKRKKFVARKNLWSPSKRPIKTEAWIFNSAVGCLPAGGLTEIIKERITRNLCRLG